MLAMNGNMTENILLLLAADADACENNQMVLDEFSHDDNNGRDSVQKYERSIIVYNDVRTGLNKHRRYVHRRSSSWWPTAAPSIWILTHNKQED